MGGWKDGQTLFHRTFSATTTSSKQAISNQQQVAEELDKPTITKSGNSTISFYGQYFGC